MSDDTCPHCGAEGKETRNIFRYEIRYDWQIDFLQIQRGEPVRHGAIYVTIEAIES